MAIALMRARDPCSCRACTPAGAPRMRPGAAGRAQARGARPGAHAPPSQHRPGMHARCWRARGPGRRRASAGAWRSSWRTCASCQRSWRARRAATGAAPRARSSRRAAPRWACWTTWRRETRLSSWLCVPGWGYPTLRSSLPRAQQPRSATCSLRQELMSAAGTHTSCQASVVPRLLRGGAARLGGPAAQRAAWCLASHHGLHAATTSALLHQA